MAQLMQMRRRIKTIETIKKVTNAMRLIAMSGHTKLKSKETIIHSYTQAIEQLYYQIKALTPPEFEPLMRPGTVVNPTPLVILVGSHKGLCGTFNEALFKLFESSFPATTSIDLVALGSKAIAFAQTYSNIPLLERFEKFSRTNLNETVWRLTKIIQKPEKPYHTVLIASNVLKTFFNQKPVITQLLPLDPNKKIDIRSDLFDDYIWEQPAEQLARDLAQLYIEAQLHQALFRSLLAEQSARFISMDNATRNAEGLLDMSKLQYNKLRQAKITREITELVSSL